MGQFVILINADEETSYLTDEPERTVENRAEKITNPKFSG